MYFVLYDRFLKSIGETYILESWNRTQRAIDFDEMKIVGEQIPYSANPAIVVVNDKQGHQLFSGLASTPSLDEKNKKSSLTLKDYLTLFNSEIFVLSNSLQAYYVGDFLSFLLNSFNQQIKTGLDLSIEFDVEDIKDVVIDESIEFPFKNKTISTSAYSLILDMITYYDLYCTSKLDLYRKTLTFKFGKAKKNRESIKLADFGFDFIEKSFGDYNRARVFNFNNTGSKVLYEYGLTTENSVIPITDGTDLNKLVYPAKYKNFVAEEVSKQNDARYDAVMGLAQNRYQENIDLDAQKYSSIKDLTKVDFSYTVDVYLKDGKYRSLPVGEIETDSKGKYIVKLGYRVQELTQEL